MKIDDLSDLWQVQICYNKSEMNSELNKIPVQVRNFILDLNVTNCLLEKKVKKS